MKIDLTQFEGLTPGPWETDETDVIMPAIGDPEHGIMDTTIMSGSPDFRKIAWVERIYNGARDLEMEHANARAIAAVPDLIAEITRLATLRAQVEKWRDWCRDKDDDPYGAECYNRVLALIDGEVSK